MAERRVKQLLVTADSNGNITANFGPVPVGHVYEGSLSVTPQDNNAILNIEIGNVPWGGFNGNQVSTTVQQYLPADGELVVTGAGFTPQSQYTIWFTGIDYIRDTDRPILLIPASPLSANITTTGVSLENYSGSLQADYNVPPNSEDILLTTPSLDIGTWLFSAVAYGSSINGGTLNMEVAPYSGTATLAGVSSSMVPDVAGVMAISCIVTVTVPGNLVLTVKNTDASNTNYIYSSTYGGFSNSTGYTIIKIG